MNRHSIISERDSSPKKGFTHPLLIYNSNNLFELFKHKRRYFVECWLMVPTDFHSPFYPTIEVADAVDLHSSIYLLNGLKPHEGVNGEIINILR